MSSCEAYLEALSALLDGELGPEEELELRRHVDGCETCRAWRVQFEALSTGVANSIGRARAPRALVHSVRGLRVSPSSGQVAGAAAAGAALLATLVFFGPTPADDASTSRLLADHQRFVSGRAKLALLSSDSDAVARGLAARLPFRVAVAEIEGARLLGGQDCSLSEGRAAYLQYEYEGERVSVFVAPRLPPALGAEPCRRIAGATLCTYTGPRETVAVVASNLATAQAFRRAAWIVE